jgi:hypothetical protein
MSGAMPSRRGQGNFYRYVYTVLYVMLVTFATKGL